MTGPGACLCWSAPACGRGERARACLPAAARRLTQCVRVRAAVHGACGLARVHESPAQGHRVPQVCAGVSPARGGGRVRARVQGCGGVRVQCVRTLRVKRVRRSALRRLLARSCGSTEAVAAGPVVPSACVAWGERQGQHLRVLQCAPHAVRTARLGRWAALDKGGARPVHSGSSGLRDVLGLPRGPVASAPNSAFCARRSAPLRAVVPHAELDRIYDIKYFGKLVFGGGGVGEGGGGWKGWAEGGLARAAWLPAQPDSARLHPPAPTQPHPLMLTQCGTPGARSTRGAAGSWRSTSTPPPPRMRRWR